MEKFLYLVRSLNIIGGVNMNSISGGSGDGEQFDTILDYDVNDEIFTIFSKMLIPRTNHAVSIVTLGDFFIWCM